jgi:hypothetical protein
MKLCFLEITFLLSLCRAGSFDIAPYPSSLVPKNSFFIRQNSSSQLQIANRSILTNENSVPVVEGFGGNFA